MSSPFPVLALALALALCAAPAHAKKPNLKKVEVSSLAVTAGDGSGGVCAGQPDGLRIQATLADGTVLDTSSEGDQGLRFKDFDVTTDRGTLDKSGVLLVENTGPELIHQSVKLSVASKKTPVTADAALQLHFGCEVRLDYRGDSTPGSALPPDPSAPSAGKYLLEGWKAMGAAMVGVGGGGPPGEKGADGAEGGPGQAGQTGQTGGPGSPGDPGHSLNVDVSLLEGDLVLVTIDESAVKGGTRMVVLNPSHGGHLVLDTSGGRGGEGGAGGKGGNGGPGIADYNSGNGGNGAPGGNGGTGGPGGPGGNVTVRYDASHAELAKLVTVRSDGGLGGLGGEGGSFGSGGAGIEGASDGTMGSTAAQRGPSGPDGVAGQVSVVPVPAGSLAHR